MQSTGANANRPLSEEELLELIEQPRTLSRDPELVAQVLRRALLALRARSREVGDLRRTIDHVNDARASQDHPVAKGLAALRELGEIEREEAMGAFLSEKLGMAEKAEKDAERARAGARSETNRVKFVLAKLTEDTTLDSVARTKIRGALESLGGRTAAQHVEAAASQRIEAAQRPAPTPRLPESFMPPPREDDDDTDLSRLFEPPE